MWPSRLPRQLIFKRYANGELRYISSFEMRNAVNDAGERGVQNPVRLCNVNIRASLNPCCLFPLQAFTWTTSCTTSSPCATRTSTSTSALTVTSAASWGWRGCSVRPPCRCLRIFFFFLNWNLQIDHTNGVCFLSLQGLFMLLIKTGMESSSSMSWR